MSKHLIIPGDFLKNAGIVGLYYMLKEYNIDILEGREYGIKEQGSTEYGFEPYESGLWLDEDFIENADWTDIFFKACVKYYRDSTVYARVLDNINVIIDKIDNDVWQENSANKDMLKFISDKLLSNSYKSGFDNIKNDIENAYIYENLQKEKLSFKLDACELKRRLEELNIFLKQPLCEETFVMKSVIYNYINRFWDGKCFLLRANAKKNMRILFEQDFVEPFKEYVKKLHSKDKDICIDCGKLLGSRDKVSIAFMKDMADDLSRKKSAFWNCKVDAFLCPECAFIYAFCPLGFNLLASRFAFLNTNISIRGMIEANKKNDYAYIKENDIYPDNAVKREKESYSQWFARMLNRLMEYKLKELSSVQVIIRGTKQDDKYVFAVVSNDALKIIKEKKVQNALQYMQMYPYIMIEGEYINIHEQVVLNILNFKGQELLLNRVLRASIESPAYNASAYWIYNVLLWSNIVKSGKENGGKIAMNRLAVMNSGYSLRTALLASKGAKDDECIRGTLYQLMNALSTKNTGKYLEIVMRLYSSCKIPANEEQAGKLVVPSAFVNMFNNPALFEEYGYAFLLGLKGCNSNSKKQDNKND